MKKLRKGFTLAEVLIALTVIGIIAAITLPTTLSNYQAKTVGVKLAKFASNLESSAISYVADFGTFENANNVSKFLNKSLLVKKTVSSNTSATSGSTAQNGSTNQNSEKLIQLLEQKTTDMPTSITILRDGTGITALNEANLSFKKNANYVDKYKVGEPKFAIKFYPNVKGLPSFAQQNFNFVVTELGYVYPHDDDACLWALYNNDYATNSDTYSEGSACVAVANNTTGTNIGTGNKIDFENLSNIINDKLMDIESAQEANIENSYNKFK